MKSNTTAKVGGGMIGGGLLGILAIGVITQTEIIELDESYRTIEAIVDDLEAGSEDPRSYDYEGAIALLDEHVSDFRDQLTEAYLYNEPPPVDPPIDPPPPVVGEYEAHPVFLPGGQYEHLGVAPVAGDFEVWDSFTGIYNGCWNSTDICEFPTDQWRGRTIVFNNGVASWGEHGPKWGTRPYNATGTVEDLTLWRVGDWEQGREGHGHYWNAWQEIAFIDCHVFEGGGQAWQLVWRPSETLIPPDQWENELYTVTFKDCSATDNGQINFGAAVRASYPISFFNPGQHLVIDGLTITCEFPPYTDESEILGYVQSHGGVFIGPGQTYRRTPSVTIDGLYIDIVASDRGELTMWAVDQGTVNEPYIVDKFGTADVKIVDDCGPISINNVLTPMQVGIYETHPHKPAREVHSLAVGQSLVWDGQGVTIQ